MSTPSQNTSTPEDVDTRQAYLDTALRIATIMAEANARIFKLQSEAASAALAENSKHLKILLETKDPAAALAQWTGLYQANMHRVLEVTRTCFEMVPQTQAEMAKLVGAPFSSYHKETQQYLDQFMKAIVDGRDATAAQMKDFLAKAVESVRAPQDANQENVAWRELHRPVESSN
jgi:phasin family protein